MCFGVLCLREYTSKHFSVIIRKTLKGRIYMRMYEVTPCTRPMCSIGSNRRLRLCNSPDLPHRQVKVTQMTHTNTGSWFYQRSGEFWSLLLFQFSLRDLPLHTHTHAYTYSFVSGCTQCKNTSLQLSLFWLVGFDGISSFVGYLIPILYLYK